MHGCSTGSRIGRRSLLMAAAAAATLCRAQAQQHRRYVVLSLIGDRLTIVGAQTTVGSNLDRNLRSDIADAQGAFDRFALGAASEAISRAEPGSTVSMLNLPGSRLYDEPERLFQRDAVALPGAAVDAIEQRGATHLVLITKHAGEARFFLSEQSIGIGKLKGVGYYVDPETRLKDVNSGRASGGFLGPFVYVRLSLVDVSTGAVVREELIRATQVLPTYTNPSAATPWEVLSGEQKVERLKGMIEAEIRKGMAALLAAR
jgi:hypothetical protein